jgi:hypothetical protein
VAQQVHAVALAAYDLIIRLELEDVSVDGCITKAPCGGPLPDHVTGHLDARLRQRRHPETAGAVGVRG